MIFKKIVVIIFLLATLFAYAEAPELRKVMPNSWRKLTMLTENEQENYIANHGVVFANIDKYSYYDYFSGSRNYSKDTLRIYRQNIGSEAVYYLIYTEKFDVDLLLRGVNFLQAMIYDETLVFLNPYGRRIIGEKNSVVSFISFDAIEKNDILLGFMHTYLEVLSPNGVTYLTDNNNQIASYEMQSYYILKGEINDDSIFLKHYARFKPREGLSYINISASSCLIDPDIPLRYSLQNAFDGDPATSYVENIEEDLMQINIYCTENQVRIKKLAIINGYAQNNSLYQSNNRVKRMSIGSSVLNQDTGFAEFIEYSNIIFDDNMLDYQFVDTDDYYIILNVKEIYTGDRYNDTCIAELNVKTDNGWLFGDIDE